MRKSVLVDYLACLISQRVIAVVNSSILSKSCFLTILIFLRWKVLSLATQMWYNMCLTQVIVLQLNSTLYRTPIVQRERIAQLIKQMEEQGIVKPSCSPWASPVVLVPKKDGSTRFCVDYRRLNTVTRKDVYPLPHIDDILDTLGRAKYFTTLSFICWLLAGGA